MYPLPVPSHALTHWSNHGQRALDEIEAAHRALGGGGRGRRYATLQVNHGYAMLLSSQFQGFCRDLHTEAGAVVAGAVAPAALRGVMQNLLVQGRKLDSGNANPGNLGSDFARFGMQFWPAVNALDRRNGRRQAALEELNTWRNAVAHRDWGRVGPALGLRHVRVWRAACRGLARDFDRAVGAYLAHLVGTRPW
jgi:hypothetical protein